jgi:hypothetical protein
VEEADPHLLARQEVHQVLAALAHLQAKLEVSALVVRVQEVTVLRLLHQKQVIQPPRTAIMEQ